MARALMGIGLLLILGGAYGLFEVSSLFALNESQRKEAQKYAAWRGGRATFSTNEEKRSAEYFWLTHRTRKWCLIAIALGLLTLLLGIIYASVEVSHT